MRLFDVNKDRDMTSVEWRAYFPDVSVEALCQRSQLALLHVFRPAFE